MGKPGRPRKIKSVKQMEKAWEEYKADCDNKMVLTHAFSAKNSEFVSKELKRRVPYLIVGFCDSIGMTYQAFHETYANDPEFLDIVKRIYQGCEVDAVNKFLTGELPSQLAGLILSKYGYSTKSEGNVQVKNSVQIVDDLDG